jgi:hypothetical protein
MNSRDASPLPAVGTTRRRMLTLLGGGGGAVAVTQLVSGSAAAADGDPLILGNANEASAGTSLTNLGANGLNVHNPNGGVAFGASSSSGIGASFSSESGQALVASGPSQFSASSGFAVSVDNPDGGGIQIHSGPAEDDPSIKANRFSTVLGDPAPAIVGVSSLPGSWSDGPNIGVLGGSGTGEGLHGHSTSGVGVGASCDSGVGMQGYSATGIGGWFLTEDVGGGIALRVSGIAEFDHVGSAEVPAGQNSVFVDNPTVKESSHITVTLISDPGGRSLRWVEKSPGSGFWVHLTGAGPKNRPPTGLTYQITEPTTG